MHRYISSICFFRHVSNARFPKTRVYRVQEVKVSIFFRNRFQGINSASICSLAGRRYDIHIPTRFLAPIDWWKFQDGLQISLRRSIIEALLWQNLVLTLQIGDHFFPNLNSERTPRDLPYISLSNSLNLPSHLYFPSYFHLSTDDMKMYSVATHTCPTSHALSDSTADRKWNCVEYKMASQ
jgi:hypothetical protein